MCACVCWRVPCFTSGQAFSFVASDRKKAAIVFHSLKASVFYLCGDEGEGTQAFLVNNVEGSLLISCFNVFSSFHLPFHLFFRCVWKTLTCFLWFFYVPRPSFGKCIHTQDLSRQSNKLKRPDPFNIYQFICETISVLFMNITINGYIIILYFFTPAMVHMEMLATFPKHGCISHLLSSM